MTQHPNAIYGGLVGGSGFGATVAWLLNDVLAWGVPDPAVAAIAGGIAFVVLFVGSNGIRGTLARLWIGKGSPA